MELIIGIMGLAIVALGWWVYLLGESLGVNRRLDVELEEIVAALGADQYDMEETIEELKSRLEKLEKREKSDSPRKRRPE